MKKKVYAGVRSRGKAEALVEKFGDRVVPLEIDYTLPGTIKGRRPDRHRQWEIVVSNAGILDSEPMCWPTT